MWSLVNIGKKIATSQETIARALSAPKGLAQFNEAVARLDAVSKAKQVEKKTDDESEDDDGVDVEADEPPKKVASTSTKRSNILAEVDMNAKKKKLLEKEKEKL